jgi:Tfp pilus assembly protein PilF
VGGADGEIAAARARLRAARRAGDAEDSAVAAYNLGLLLEEVDDLDGAVEAYRLAAGSDHPDARPMAAVNLGMLLDGRGDPEGARAAYQVAIDSSHPDQLPLAALDLGALLQEHGDVTGARAAYQLAIDSSHPEHAPRASVNLGILLEDGGDLAGARLAYAAAVDSGHADAAPRALRLLGAMPPAGDEGGYRLDSAALATLTRTFWTSRGWRVRGEDEASRPGWRETEEAIAAGVMFDPPEWSPTHDELIAAARAAAAAVGAQAVAEAFLASLSSRRLDLRSALGSYALARVLPEHALEPGPEYRCAVCGLHVHSWEMDRNELSFERFRWGGVRREDPGYVAFDLLQFARAPLRTASAEDLEIGRSLLRAIRRLPEGTTAAEAARRLRVPAGNRQERVALLDILGVCGILESPGRPGFSEGFVPWSARSWPARFVELSYPACWWRAEYGVSAANLERFLPQLAGAAPEMKVLGSRQSSATNSRRRSI